MADIKDMRGVDLAVGDTIAYAFSPNHTPYIRIGVIVEFVETKHPYRSNEYITKLRMKWTEGRGAKNSVIEFYQRALKL